MKTEICVLSFLAMDVQKFSFYGDHNVKRIIFVRV
jgi:hypothetical protein